MRMASLALSLILVVQPGRAMALQEPVDTAMARRIIDEATQRSRVMEHAFYLTDVFGPRLTGTPGFRRAGDWAAEQLRRMGLSNVRTGPVPWGRSWVERSFGVRLLLPVSANV